MSTAVVLFTRDLRVRDNPALAAAAARFDEIVPLFVLEERLLGSPNRNAFLLEALADLRAALGGRLVVRRGDVVVETLAIRPDAVFVAADSSAYARNRERRLAERVELIVMPGAAIVPPGELHPAGGDHYRVFTPYWRVWAGTPLRASRRRAAHDPASGRHRPGQAADACRARPWCRFARPSAWRGARRTPSAYSVSRDRPCHLRRHAQRLLAGLDLPALAVPPLRLRLAGRARAARARAGGGGAVPAAAVLAGLLPAAAGRTARPPAGRLQAAR